MNIRSITVATASLFALAALALNVRPAASQSPSAQTAQQRGATIAAQRCGVCHATGRDGPSPQRSAPLFREFEEIFPVEMLVQSLKTGVVGGHDEMPMFELGPEDTRALLAHIDSFAPAGKRYLELPK